MNKNGKSLSITIALYNVLRYLIYSIPLKPLNNAQMSGVFLFFGGIHHEI